ncbi:hypothetical protein ACFQI7_09565 [Paenibacillus allorhizosphaerae]|uniref:GNAT family N-acetyltransferase n=1 Tax=Paenibacillus allorhizosphaerae TaxID=2849866 RepID=A0ABN7TQB7_9BACL|nr:hypothetical protein [Paenibacillus allorhizosphaerae]CAG7644306.1 hypothetical protein PAECIP111802_03223 [Paenibacillus allorhizosphaerae]
MSLQFSVCNYRAMFDHYLTLLLEHHGELNLPYDFATKLCLIASPLMHGKVIVCVDEEEHRLEGAIGCVYGTGANDFTDQDVCQIEVAFLREPFRSTPLFMRGLKFLTAFVSEDNAAVRQIQFWGPGGHSGLRRLFSKIPDMQRTEVGKLDFYKIELTALKQYCSRF